MQLAQMEEFENRVGERRLVNVPVTGKQREFLDAMLYRNDIRQVGFGGRRGPGKSYAWCLGITLRALGYENTEHLCIRRVQKAADLAIGRQFRQIFRQMGVPYGSKRKGSVQWYAKDKIFEFPNNTIIELGFCLKESDWERYQSREAATVWLSEATQFPELAFRQIGGSNRSVANPECPGKKGIDCNPGGPGHEWVRRVFVDPATRELRTVWIPAGLRDSSATLEHDPGYALRTLRNLPDWLRRQWEEGDWEAVSGQYWQIPPGQIIDVTVPRQADWYAGVDWGSQRPFAVIYMARWKEWFQVRNRFGMLEMRSRDRAHVTAEIYKAGLHYDEQAREVRELEARLPRNGHKVVYWADPKTNTAIETASTEQGKTMRDAWRMYGFYTHASRSNARIPGWNLIKLLLRRGILTISPRCLGLLSEMRAAVAEGSPGPPISEDLQQGHTIMDDAMDALRYCVLSTFGTNYTAEEADPYADPGSHPTA